MSDGEYGLDDTIAVQCQVDHDDKGSFGDFEQLRSLPILLEN
jgi:hypothetical protein